MEPSAPVRRLIWLTLFAVAMAFLEAVVVVYLRELHYPDHPLTIFPPRLLSPDELAMELGRELASVVMILSVALLAERGVTRVFAAFVYVFGLWDIFYYVWLKLTLGWPVGWLEWDLLFLIPWAWLGPWLTPVAIALLFVMWGARVLASDDHYAVSPLAWLVFVAGCALALTAFLQPAWPLLLQGPEAVRRFQPHGFWWGLFIPGYVLMVAGLGLALRRSDRSAPAQESEP